jgi:hypothetical protein
MSLNCILFLHLCGTLARRGKRRLLDSSSSTPGRLFGFFPFISQVVLIRWTRSASLSPTQRTWRGNQIKSATSRSKQERWHHAHTNAQGGGN